MTKWKISHLGLDTRSPETVHVTMVFWVLLCYKYSNLLEHKTQFPDKQQLLRLVYFYPPTLERDFLRISEY